MIFIHVWVHFGTPFSLRNRSQGEGAELYTTQFFLLFMFFRLVGAPLAPVFKIFHWLFVDVPLNLFMDFHWFFIDLSLIVDWFPLIFIDFSLMFAWIFHGFSLEFHYFHYFSLIVHWLFIDVSFMFHWFSFNFMKDLMFCGKGFLSWFIQPHTHTRQK